MPTHYALYCSSLAQQSACTSVATHPGQRDLPGAYLLLDIRQECGLPDSGSALLTCQLGCQTLHLTGSPLLCLSLGLHGLQLHCLHLGCMRPVQVCLCAKKLNFPGNCSKELLFGRKIGSSRECNQCKSVEGHCCHVMAAWQRFHWFH